MYVYPFRSCFRAVYKHTYLGIFTTADKAHAAVRHAAKSLHGPPWPPGDETLLSVKDLRDLKKRVAGESRKSNIPGVSFDKSHKSWRVRVKNIHLGYYKEREDAIDVSGYAHNLFRIDIGRTYYQPSQNTRQMIHNKLEHLIPKSILYDELINGNTIRTGA